MTSRFRQRIASHNRHVLVAAGLCFLGAWAAWLLAYGLFVGAVLGFLTVTHGQEVIAGERLVSMPGWLHLAAACAALVLVAWAVVDACRNRTKPPPDRPIVGLHLPREILLLPPRLTFGIGENLCALIRLDSSEEGVCLKILRHVVREKRCSRREIEEAFPEIRHLPRLLLALQTAGWISLLPSSEGWVYIPRSSAEEEIAEILS